MDRSAAIQRICQAAGLSAHQTLSVLQRDPRVLEVFARLDPLDIRIYREGGVPIAGVLTGESPLEQVEPYAEGVNLKFDATTRRGAPIRMSVTIRSTGAIVEHHCGAGLGEPLTPEEAAERMGRIPARGHGRDHQSGHVR